MKKTVGIVRNKTLIFSELRRELRQKRNTSIAEKGNRFSKQRLVGLQEIQLGMAEMTQTMKKPFIEDLSTVNTIEEPKPQWIAYYEECQSLIKSVHELKKEMLLNQNKRLTCIKVSEEKGYQMRIYDCVREATGRIKKCQKLLNLIKDEGKAEQSAHTKVCSTVAFRLANDIQETTKQLRLQQKSFVEQRKQFEMTQKPTFLELAVDQAFSMRGGMDELIEDETMKDLEERNEEIRHIVESIYELSDIYKELNQLVVMQGSLLDRIDQNIEVSRVAVSKGLGHLESANKYHKKTSRCGCIMTSILLILNIILLIILCKKWFT